MSTGLRQQLRFYSVSDEQSSFGDAPQSSKTTVGVVLVGCLWGCCRIFSCWGEMRVDESRRRLCGLRCQSSEQTYNLGTSVVEKTKCGGFLRLSFVGENEQRLAEREIMHVGGFSSSRTSAAFCA